MAHIGFDNDMASEFISNSGIRYSMYEGVTMGGTETRTSDIVFIMLDGYDTPAQLAYWMYGANILDNESVYSISRSVDKFEQEHKDIIDGIIGGTIARL